MASTSNVCAVDGQISTSVKDEVSKPKDSYHSSGIAIIKEEFVNKDCVRELNLDYVAHKDKKASGKRHENSEDGPPSKKLKGQNKQRPREAKVPKGEKLCLKVLAEGGCPYGDKCCFSHDIESFASKRPLDIGANCYIYDTFGYCPYSFQCRYASSHFTTDNKNLTNHELWDKAKEKKLAMNTLPKELQISLRKRNYDFEKANDVIKAISKMNSESNRRPASTQGNASSGLQLMGALTDEGLIKLRNCEKKKMDFNDKLYCAPLTTVGNLPFRRICVEYGADITCGEMAMCMNLLQGQQSEWALLKRHHTEKVFGVQVCGAHADIMTRCGQIISENLDVDFVDINMGCPIDLVFQKGAGCGLMNRAKKFEDIVYGMSSVMSVPLTVKLRTGIQSNKNLADGIISKAKIWGDRVAMISLHGRSKEQRYTKAADWDYISKCAEIASPIPLYGCGDILSYEEANLHRENSGVAGIMIARGALIKPWIFTEIKEQRHWDISSSERFDILKRYTNYGLEHWGSDNEGVERTRRFILEWLSFLYRYIPVGILEQVPHKINERPPPYFGRNDLETTMASSSCADWIKISEMLLGPVPDSFSFLPKHKANAYQ